VEQIIEILENFAERGFVLERKGSSPQNLINYVIIQRFLRALCRGEGYFDNKRLSLVFVTGNQSPDPIKIRK
jgi:hypothetical protein